MKKTSLTDGLFSVNSSLEISGVGQTYFSPSILQHNGIPSPSIPKAQKHSASNQQIQYSDKLWTHVTTRLGKQISLCTEANIPTSVCIWRFPGVGQARWGCGRQGVRHRTVSCGKGQRLPLTTRAQAKLRVGVINAPAARWAHCCAALSLLPALQPRPQIKH